MATQKQKTVALRDAIEIAKEYARSSSDADPAIFIKGAYDIILKILDEIEKDND